MPTIHGTRKQDELKTSEQTGPASLEGLWGHFGNFLQTAEDQDPMQMVGVPTGMSAEFIARAQVPRILMGGTPAMRRAGENLLPPHPAESDESYRQRKAKTFLFNGFERAIQMLVGKPFGPGGGVRLEDDVPADIVEWSKNIDLEGRTLDDFSEDLLIETLVTGMTLVMPDYPMMPEGLSLRQERDILNARPFLTMIPGDRILGWSSDRIMGHKVLTQIRWLEEKFVPMEGNEFAQQMRCRVRVLHMGNPMQMNRMADDYWAHWSMYEYDPKKEKWFDTGERGSLIPWKIIPVIPFYTARQQFMHSLPPLDDLAYKNVEHWQSSSEHRNSLMVSRIPLLFGSGIQEEEKRSRKVIGALMSWMALDSQAKLGYVQGGNESSDASFRDLDNLREEMAVLSLQPLLERSPGNETATGKLLDNSIGDSRLQAWVSSLEAVTIHALRMMSVYAGRPEDVGTVRFQTDYGLGPRDTADLQEIIKVRQLGEISRETFFEMLLERRVLPDGFDSDEEMDRIEVEENDQTGEEMEMDMDPDDEPDEDDDDRSDGGTGEEDDDGAE